MCDNQDISLYKQVLNEREDLSEMYTSFINAFRTQYEWAKGEGDRSW